MRGRHKHHKAAGGREPGIATPHVVEHPITDAGKGLKPQKGAPASFHLGKRGRKRGGRAGADASPLSSAAKHGNVHAGSDFKRGGHAEHRKDGGKAGGHWIAGAIKHPGALHRELHVPKGEKISEKKLAKAEHSENPKLRKRAKLAETLKGMHH